MKHMRSPQAPPMKLRCCEDMEIPSVVLNRTHSMICGMWLMICPIGLMELVYTIVEGQRMAIESGKRGKKIQSR